MVRFLSKHEAMQWCSDNYFPLNEWGLPDCSDPQQKFDIPVDAQKRVSLVKRIMEEFADATNLLVWFSDWAVWQSGQWHPLVNRLRASYGETRRLIDVPAHVFERGESEDATSFVVVAVLFLFDCYVICPNQRRIVKFSHDEWGLSKNVRLQPTDIQ
jgi:hypothetical protein